VGCLFLSWWLPGTLGPLSAAGFAQVETERHNLTIAKQINMDRPEYRPKWVSSDIVSILAQIGQINGELRHVKLVGGNGNIVVTKWKPREIVLQIAAQTDLTIQLSQFYYPGWVAKLDGIRELPVKPSKPDGLLTICIPSGTRSVYLNLSQTIPERLGKLISSASVLLALLALSMPQLKQLLRKKHLED
jgi:hypothetical protein